MTRRVVNPRRVFFAGLVFECDPTQFRSQICSSGKTLAKW